MGVPQEGETYLDALEGRDLMYHLLVLLEVSDVDFDEVLQILKNRMNQSGLDEKSSRFKK